MALRFLIFACTVVCLDSFAWAKEESCSKHLLTPDQRFQAVVGLPQQNAKRRAVVTDLLNEIMSPAINAFAERVRALPDSDIEALEVNELDIDDLYQHVSGSSVAFSGKYDKSISLGVGIHLKLTENNRREITRIYKVIKLASREIVWSMNSQDLTWLTDATLVVESETFNGLDIRGHLDEGLQSIGEMLSILSADEISGLTATEVIRRSSEANGTRPSLVVQAAMMLAPGVLAPMTRYNLRPIDPLSFSDGKLFWSHTMRESFKLQASKKMGLEQGQQGLGCPVARCLPGEQVSSLQRLLDIILEKARL